MAPIELSPLIATGFLATLVMTLVGYLLGAGGLTYFDLDRLFARTLGANRSAPGLGLLFHFLLGILLVLFYLAIWQVFVLGGIVGGLTFGAALWLVAIAMIVPLVKSPHLEPEHRWRTIGVLLITHLIYGLVVALLYPILARG